jgi:RNA polymerase sigma-70 factor (ECF subfamily)
VAGEGKGTDVSATLGVEGGDLAAAVGRARDQAEARLIDAAVAGDAAAFAALYDQHADRVYRHCYYRLGNRADAEDLTQQTFLAAWQAIGRYRRTSVPFIAWLLTIGQRLAISHIRRARAIAVPDVVAAAAADDPADAFGARATRALVRQAILQLKPERREVILLRYIEGFTVAEVAAALGKTDNNVRVIQHRALADLRRCLADPALEAAAPADQRVGRVRAAVAGALQRARRYCRATDDQASPRAE